MPFGEGGFRPKTTPELGKQLKTTQEVLGKRAEYSLVPPSIEKKDILKMPLAEIKEKYVRRYEMYLQLLREKRHQEVEGESALGEEDLSEMRKWLSAINSLDGYITSHKEGRDVTLRERQLTVFEDLRNFVEAGGQEGYVKLPTGVGKTVLFTEFIEAVDLKTLVVVPTNVLVRQTEGKMAQFAPDLDVGKVSGQAKQFGRQVTIITYDSFVRQIDSGQIKPEDFDCLILDEIHLSLSKKRMEMVKKFEKALKIGFTATPQYSAKKKVSNLLETEIHKMTLREAIEDEGLLCPVSSMLVKTEVNLSKVTTAYHGDYNEGELARAVNVAGRNKAAVDLYKEMFSGQTTVTYCVGIEHAHAVAKLFNENGVAAVVISGKTPPGEQEKILKRFHNGEIKVLCNADLLTVGFDEPRASVCLNLRPTRSKVLAEQRGGRVLRLDGDNPDKEAFVVDFIDQGLDDKHLPVLFADVADGARFRRRSGYGSETGGGVVAASRVPIIHIPGIEVITDVTEIMRIVNSYHVEQAGEEGTFEEGGEIWGTVGAFSRLLEIANNTIDDRIAKYPCRVKKGKDSSGALQNFYSLSDVKKACGDFLEAIEVDESGLVNVEGETVGSILGLSNFLRIKYSTLQRRLRGLSKEQKNKLRTWSGRFSNGLFILYAASEIRQVCSDIFLDRESIKGKAGKDGTFFLKKERYGTQNGLANILKIGSGPLRKKIRQNKNIRPVKGRALNGKTLDFYRFSEIKKISSEMLVEKPSANEDGYFIFENEKWVTISFLVKLTGISWKTIKNRLGSCKSKKGIARNKRDEIFYALSDALKRVVI